MEKIDLWKQTSEAIASWFTSDSVGYVKGNKKNPDRMSESNTKREVTEEVIEQMTEQMNKIGAFYRGSTEVSLIQELQIKEKETCDNLPAVPMIGLVSH